MFVVDLIKKLLDYPGDAIVCGMDNENGEFEIDDIELAPMPEVNFYIDKKHSNKIVILT